MVAMKADKPVERAPSAGILGPSTSSYNMGSESPQAVHLMQASELRRIFLSVPRKEWSKLLHEVPQECRDRFKEYIRNSCSTGTSVSSGGGSVDVISDQDFMIPVFQTSDEPFPTCSPGTLFSVDLDALSERKRKLLVQRLKLDVPAQEEKLDKRKDIVAKLCKPPAEEATMLEQGRDVIRKSLFLRGDPNFEFPLHPKDVKLQATVTQVLDNVVMFCRILCTPVSLKVVKRKSKRIFVLEDVTGHHRLGSYFNTEFGEIINRSNNIFNAAKGLQMNTLFSSGDVEMNDLELKDIELHEFQYIRDAKNEAIKAAEADEEDLPNESDEEINKRLNQDSDQEEGTSEHDFHLLKREIMPKKRLEMRSEAEKERTAKFKKEEYLSFTQLRNDVGKGLRKFFRLFFLSQNKDAYNQGLLILQDRLACIVEHALRVAASGNTSDSKMKSKPKATARSKGHDYTKTIEQFNEWDKRLMEKYNMIDEKKDETQKK